MDIAGRYPINSAHGNQCILVCYDYDSNAILTEALPSISVTCINKGVQKLLDTLTTAGQNPKLQIMDNEAFDILKNILLKRKIHYQIFPPYIHRRNSSKRAIQTFKDHFIAGL